MGVIAVIFNCRFNDFLTVKSVKQAIQTHIYQRICRCCALSNELLHQIMNIVETSIFWRNNVIMTFATTTVTTAIKLRWGLKHSRSLEDLVSPDVCLCQIWPKWTVLVITKIICYVCVVVNPPVWARFLTEITFWMLKYNYCCYAWIFKFQRFTTKRGKK